MSLAPPRQAGDGDAVQKCTYCKEIFPDRDSLREHKIELRDREYAEATFEKPYILHNYCEFCDCDSITSAAAREHWLQVCAAPQIPQRQTIPSPLSKTDIQTVPR